jgi:[ribosomal protein S5]-alanine N-acetyltransferase
MKSDDLVIESERLRLIHLSPAFLQHTLDRNQAAAEALLGSSVPLDWFQEQTIAQLRMEQLQNFPDYHPWSLRAIEFVEQKIMIGHIGFHTPPGAEYLRGIASRGIEFGFTVFAPFRRRGFAHEACEGLIKWAVEKKQVQEFVLTISPENSASRQLSARLGFEQVGSHIDEVDGLEYIYTFKVS